jgi:hypothetical protein
MKKILYILAVSALWFGCTKKTAEDPAPVSNGKASSVQLRVQTSEIPTPSANAEVEQTAGGSMFITIGFRPGILTPNVTYNTYVLQPVITYPTYEAIGGQSSGLSQACYSSLTSLAQKAIDAQFKLAFATDFSSYCDLISEMRNAASQCPEASSLNQSCSSCN